METVIKYITETGQSIVSFARQFTFKDAVDVAIVTFLIYSAIKLVRETRAGQLVKGLILLAVIFVISSQFKFLMLSEILRAFFEFAIIALLIVFQPEIRKALEQMGRSKVGQSIANAVGAKDKSPADTPVRAAIEGVVEATALLQQLRMGALIVFERKTRLGEIVETGSVMDCSPSAQLIANIFFNKAPLHDGGMVIREGRIAGAGCILPLTGNSSLNASLGTRHRAALGMSENSDAVVVVVSEETGQISIAINGNLTRNYNRSSLRGVLEKELLSGEKTNLSGGRRILGKLGLSKKEASS